MDNLDKIIESILFVSGDAISFIDIAEKLQIELDEVKNAVEKLQKDRKNDGINVQIFNDKAQLCSNPVNSESVAEVLNPIREKQLTKVVMEVCAIIAYKQPITRLEIENFRGYNSDYAVSTLLENNLIEVVGRKDVVGKPLLFGTTDKFLKKFGLASLSDLPDYEELLDRIKILHENSNGENLFGMDKLMEQASQENDKKETISETNISINVNNNIIHQDKAIDELEENELKKILLNESLYDTDEILGKSHFDNN